MRIATIATPDGPRAAVLRGSEAFVLAAAGRDWPASVLELAEGADRLLPAIADWLPGATGGRSLASVRLLAPIANPSKLVAIGLNYADHAAESGQQVPAQPLVFAKFPSTIVGPGDVVEWDRGLTDRVDYEAELGVIIGRAARRVGEADALGHVFGYTCINDVSARDLQFGDGQWVRGKSLDTFCPIGPWIVTADEIPDPQTLAISCTVGGERLQDSTTANMFFPVRTIISRLSAAFTLLPGDVIATGTPAGVGVAKKPPRLLRDGDEMIVAIERIGELRNTCRTTGEPVAAPTA